MIDKLREAFEECFALADLNCDNSGEYCHKDTRRLFTIFSKGYTHALESLESPEMVEALEEALANARYLSSAAIVAGKEDPTSKSYIKRMVKAALKAVKDNMV